MILCLLYVSKETFIQNEANVTAHYEGMLFKTALSPMSVLGCCENEHQNEEIVWDGQCDSVFLLLIPVSFEFGRAVWLRFYPSAYPPCPHPSFVAHLGGVAVGITLGVVILRNYEQRLQDQSLWWIFISMYVVFVLFAIFWNIFAYNLLDLKLPPPPWEPWLRNSQDKWLSICQLHWGKKWNLRIYFCINITGCKKIHLLEQHI